MEKKNAASTSKGYKNEEKLKEYLNKFQKWKEEKQKQKLVGKNTRKPPFVAGVYCEGLTLQAKLDTTKNNKRKNNKASDLSSCSTTSSKTLQKSRSGTSTKVRNTPSKNKTQRNEDEPSSKHRKGSAVPKINAITPKKHETHKFRRSYSADNLKTPTHSSTKTNIKTPKSLNKSNQRKKATPKKCDDDKTPKKTPKQMAGSSVTPKSISRKTPQQSKRTQTTRCKSASPDYPANNFGSETPTYLSPFVTVSRGKNSARKEHLARKSLDLNELSDNSSQHAAANYFLSLLNHEIDRLQDMCDLWTGYKTSSDIPEGVEDMIDVCTGQTNLLISQKFQQFRRLLKQYKNQNPTESLVITNLDLHGFWDMMYIQVENINKRFGNLQRLKDNNWEEILDGPKRQVKVVKKHKPLKNKSKSALREMIKAARKEKKSEQAVLDNKATPRRNLRVAQLNPKIQVERLSTSPGAVMIRVSQAIKCGDGITPGKSILKRKESQSAKKIYKTVLFDDDKENVFNCSF